MKKLLTIISILFFTSLIVKAESFQYYDLETPINLQKKQDFNYMPQSALKPNKKEFVETSIPENIKYNYSPNTNSLPKGIYKNRFIYTNAPFGGLTPTHIPSFDTQFQQY